MNQKDNNRFLKFMDWFRETYQCPYHPGWAMTIEAEFPIPRAENNKSGMSYVAFCSASKEWGAEIEHPLGDPDRCGYHIHIDDLRKLKLPKVITDEGYLELKNITKGHKLLTLDGWKEVL